jgi:glycosyltransferase involved in cell wall biosynthesis
MVMTAATATDGIRVLYLTGGRRIGGMETHLIKLASGLPLPFRCVICCLDASPDYSSLLDAAGIHYSNLDWPSLVHPKGYRGFARLMRLVSRFRPHLVHSYGFVADVAAAFVRARYPAVRIVTSRRGEDGNRRHQALRRVVNRWSQKIVCVSAETAQFVRETESTAHNLLAIIPNGVDLAPADTHHDCRGHDGILRFGTLGTVKPIKGTDLLVDAFMRFDASQRVELVIAGLIDRPWAQSLRQRASMDLRIHFVGRTSDSNNFLSTLNVFVLPSRSEGMSNALLEAMSVGLPCIATSVGSNRSLLVPDDAAPAGLICDPDPESLFRAMQYMALTEDSRGEYGRQGTELVRTRYAIPTMVHRYERLYRSVVGDPSTSPDTVGAHCLTK